MCQIEELSVWCLSTATNPENLDFRLLFCRTEHGQVGFRPEKERSGNRCHPSEADVRNDADQGAERGREEHLRPAVWGFCLKGNLFSLR